MPYFGEPYSEGMRRLSIALGGVGALGWLAFILYALVETPPRDAKGAIWVGVVIVVGFAVCYGVPYGAVRLADWVWAGFQKD